MVDALVSGASAARRAGSSPVLGTSTPLIIDRFSRGFLFPKCTKSVLNAKVYCKSRSQKERIDDYFRRILEQPESLSES